MCLNEHSMKNILILFLTLTAVSCKWSNASLGDNYWYLDIYEAEDTGYPDGAIIYKSSERYSYKKIMVKGNVMDVSHNDKYILAKQVPIDNSKIEYFFLIDKDDEKVYGLLGLDSLMTLKSKKEILLELR